MGWMNESGVYTDSMQEMMCEQVIDLLQLFSSHGHSGSTAPYAIELFSKLAEYKPLGPLTGEDWEWTELDYDSDVKYQNKRCGGVFKRTDGSAYYIDGKVFWEWCERQLDPDEEGYPGLHMFKSYFTNRDSRVDITFPYTPETEYVEVKRC
jgi:hypothetical protein